MMPLRAFSSHAATPDIHVDPICSSTLLLARQREASQHGPPAQ
ncbi:hypothetical protein OAG82_03290 [Rubripirellula sp.]|nr:hypothetical protein [Rubripirellula sp.]MDB4621863.1 hypothetical protein [Rubripirellula sp.]